MLGEIYAGAQSRFTNPVTLKRLVNLMDGADRLSLTFRFEDGSSTLDAQSRDNLADLAQLIASGQFRNERMVLTGFSDGSGTADANLALSIERDGQQQQVPATVLAADSQTVTVDYNHPLAGKTITYTVKVHAIGH